MPNVSDKLRSRRRVCLECDDVSRCPNSLIKGIFVGNFRNNLIYFKRKRAMSQCQTKELGMDGWMDAWMDGWMRFASLSHE